MLDHEADDDVILLDKPVLYVDADEVIDEVSHDDKTAQYVLGHVEDHYEEMLELEDVDDDVETQQVVLLDLRRLEVDPDLDDSELS